MLTDKECRMIKKLYSKVNTAPIYLLAIPLSLILTLISQMIVSIVFEYDKPNVLSIYVPLLIFPLYLLIFCFQFSSVIVGVLGKKWNIIVEKAQVELTRKNYSSQAAASVGLTSMGNLMNLSHNKKVDDIGDAAKITGGLFGAVVISDMSHNTSDNIKKVASAMNVRLPKTKWKKIAILIFPIVITILVNIPYYIEAVTYTNITKQMASDSITRLVESLQSVCENVRFDDPMVNYNNYGYNVSGTIKRRGEKNNSCIYVEIDNEGNVTNVSYWHEVDITLSKEENLDTAQRDFATLSTAFKQSDVKVKSENLFREEFLNEDFKKLFNEKAYHESINLNCGIPNFLVYYDAEFGEYENPHIGVSIWGTE